MSDYNEEAYENALIERSRIWDGSMFMGRKLTATFYDSVLEDSIRRLNPKAAPDDKNSYIVANQWTFIENSNKRPDILLFLNGLSVCLFELKSPSLEQTDASEAYTQIRNYMQEIPSMFIYNCICVVSDQLTSKAGTITSGEDRFMEWKNMGVPA